MKVLLMIVVMVNALYSWTFTKEDLVNMNSRQLDVYHTAKEIGHKYGLGDTLIKIAAVETRFGKVKDRKDRQYCGPMQISVRHSKIPCKVLNNNIYVAMEYAAREIIRWKKVSKGSISKAIMLYNTGYNDVNNRGAIFLSRVNKVKGVLDKHRHIVAKKNKHKQLIAKI